MQTEALPEALLSRWVSVLDEEERAQAARFRFAADRETYVGAHMLTRTLLSHLDGRPATQWRFAKGAHGKPEIDASHGSPRLRFNLSHARGLVVCAAGFLDGDLGVDVEAAQRTGDLLALAGRFFAPAEVALLRSMPEEARRHGFLRIWTLKEAFIKATGEGLSRALDSFAFGLDPITVDIRDGDPLPWHFEQFDATPRHVVALAMAARAAPDVARRRVAAAQI